MNRNQNGFSTTLVLFLVAGMAALMAWLSLHGRDQYRTIAGEKIGQDMLTVKQFSTAFVDRYASELKQAFFTAPTIGNFDIVLNGINGQTFRFAANKFNEKEAVFDSAGLKQIFGLMHANSGDASDERVFAPYKLRLILSTDNRTACSASDLPSCRVDLVILDVRQITTIEGRLDRTAIQAALKRIGDGAGTPMLKGNIGTSIRFRGLEDDDSIAVTGKETGVIALRRNDLARQSDFLPRSGGEMTGPLAMNDQPMDKIRKLTVGEITLLGSTISSEKALHVVAPSQVFGDSSLDEPIVFAGGALSTSKTKTKELEANLSVKLPHYQSSSACTRGRLGIGDDGVPAECKDGNWRPLKGESGLTGKDGQDGLNGKRGPDGKPGPDGKDGSKGQKGPRGVSVWRGSDAEYRVIQERDFWRSYPGPFARGRVNDKDLGNWLGCRITSFEKMDRSTITLWVEPPHRWKLKMVKEWNDGRTGIAYSECYDVEIRQNGHTYRASDMGNESWKKIDF